MGALLSFPLGLLIGLINKLQPSENWFKYILTLIYLKFCSSKHLRVTNYNIKSDDAFTCGYLSSETEKELEHPKNLNPQEIFDTDSIEFFGNSSAGDNLGLSISRHSSGRNEVLLHLHLSNGKTYVLPDHPNTPLFIDSKNKGVFEGSGLKIACQSPLRRWKISFNGLLREQSSDSDEQSQVVHVKFIFLFSITSKIYDFQTDIPLSMTSGGLIRANGFLPSQVKKLKEWMNYYEQWGTFRGTVNVENTGERKVYLWGHRSRNRGICDLKAVKRILKVHICMEDGTMLSICAMTLNNVVKCFQYGYIYLPTTDVLHITSFVNLCLSDVAMDGTIPKRFSFSFHSGTRMFVVDSNLFGDTFTTFYGEKSETKIVHSMANFALPNQHGYGVIQLMYKNNDYEKIRKYNGSLSSLKEIDLSPGCHIPNVVSLKDHLCQSSAVAGGKGCSLALLHELAMKQNDFLVPPGIVITTSAYRKYITENTIVLKAILDLEQLARKNSDSLEGECKKVSKLIEATLISNSLKDVILKSLGEVFTDDYNSIKFAVRSSCQSEDSAETSSAGQMLSILGVSGMDQLLSAILKCWGSQFSYTAVQYKRQNGQVINDSMAVVIQEMVPAEVAGVMFTCDPVTGNPSLTSITSNYGIGESVVSASAEPDTIILQRCSDNKIIIKDKILGSKSLKILLSDLNGTVTQESSDTECSAFCLSDEMAVQLTKIGQIVEQAYGSSRDIEWAISKRKTYLLQSRPVTALDLGTEFELIHELDSGLKTEYEYTTRANVGEVYPGAATPLSISTTMSTIDYAISEIIFGGITKSQIRAPVPGFLLFQFRQLTMNVIDLCFRINPEDTHKSSRDIELAIFGTYLDEEIRQQGIHRYGYTSEKLPFFITLCLNAWKLYRGNKLIKEQKKKYFNYQFPLEKYDSSSELFKETVKRFGDIMKHSCMSHSQNTILSSWYISIVLSTLQRLNGECSEGKVLTQFSKVMSNCSDVLSADVPSGIQALAHAIIKCGQKDKFAQMSVKDATSWIQNDKGLVGKSYNKFIKLHGHRCIREFDLHAIPWKNNPTSLIESIQNVLNISTLNTEKTESSVKNIISQLEVPPLGLLEKLNLRLLLYLARQSVRQREANKSLMIKSVDILRDVFWRMGELMVSEGRLPKSELICFLTYEEVAELVKTRSPEIVNRATRRLRIHDKLDSIKLPEIIKGIEKPIELNEPNNLTATDVIKGFPVYPGVIRGIARVVPDFKHVSEIQKGDILIAYSTDIGWTPYFPLLSGVVTELGGLVSHGAVVAREYGLPCLLSAKGCTAIFKSGDFVELDATQGTLKKLQTL